MLSGPLPRGRLALWALLVPLAYAPALLVGERPGPDVWFAVALACALALAAWRLLLGGTALDALAARLAPRAGLIVGLGVAFTFVASLVTARVRVAMFYDYNQLGLFTQSAWSTLHGHAFANNSETVDGTLGSHFGIHFSPTLLGLVPLYALWRTPLALLAAQSAALALAAVPLYHLLKREAGPAGAAVLALALLALPLFAWGGARDFHDLNFVPVLLLTVVWAAEARRTGWMLVAAITALGVREDVGFTLVLVAFYLLLRGCGLRTAATLAVLGLVWNAIGFRVVMPHFRSPGLWIDPTQMFEKLYGQWGATPARAALAMLTHPVALARMLIGRTSAHYLYELFVPLLLLPPFGTSAIVVALPGLATNLLSRLGNMRDPSLYYSLMPITFAALSAFRLAAATAARAAETRRAATGLALGLIVFAGTLPALALTREGRPARRSPPPAIARALIAVIPKDAVVYAPESLYPALGTREQFGCYESVGPRPRDPGFRARYDWIVLWPAADRPGQTEDAALADSLAHDPRFESVAGHAPFTVWRRR